MGTKYKNYEEVPAVLLLLKYKETLSDIKALCDLSDMHKSTLTREAYLMQRIELISKAIGE